MTGPLDKDKGNNKDCLKGLQNQFSYHPKQHGTDVFKVGFVQTQCISKYKFTQ